MVYSKSFAKKPLNPKQSKAVGYLIGNGDWCDVGIVNAAIEREMSFRNEPTELTHLVRLLTNLGFEVFSDKEVPVFRIGAPLANGQTYKFIKKKL